MLVKKVSYYDYFKEEEKTVIEKATFSDFLREFKIHNRNYVFSSKGKVALFNYLDELKEPIELDVIAICRKFTEFEDLTEFNSYYGCELDSVEEITILTTVIPIDNESFIIEDF